MRNADLPVLRRAGSPRAALTLRLPSKTGSEITCPKNAAQRGAPGGPRASLPSGEEEEKTTLGRKPGEQRSRGQILLQCVVPAGLDAVESEVCCTTCVYTAQSAVYCNKII